MKNNLVVIPFDIPWNWSTDYTKKTAEILSRSNKVLCLLLEDSFSIKEYVVSKEKPRVFEKHSDNLYLFRPVQFFPFRRYKIISDLNVRLNLLIASITLKLYRLFSKVKESYLWIFHPKLYPVTKYFDNNFKIVYDCVDFFDYGIDEKESKRLKNYEENLAQKAHLVTANSKVLLKRLKKMRKDTHLVPQGFSIKNFENYEKKVKKPKIDIAMNEKKPVVGYVGGINYRLDFNLLKKLTKDNPRWNFVLWGPIQKPEKETERFQKNLDSLSSYSNVYRGVAKEREKIPAVIEKFDVAMIPYNKDLDFNRFCYPMKTFEYFYLGKPVVSTPIEELERFPKFVKIGKNIKEWQNIINNLLSETWPEPYKARQKSLAEENSWENKINKVVDLI